jgi:hypothetical protein
MFVSHHAHWIDPLLNPGQVFLEQPTNLDGPQIALSNVFNAAITNLALRDPRHDVLTFHVIGEDRAIGLHPWQLVLRHRVLWIDRIVLARVVRGVEHDPRLGVIDRYTDLRLLNVGPTYAHAVREHQRVADLPIVVFFA